MSRLEIIILVFRSNKHREIRTAQGQLVTGCQHERTTPTVWHRCDRWSPLCRWRPWWAQDSEHCRVFWSKEETVDHDDVYGYSSSWTWLVRSFYVSVTDARHSHGSSVCPSVTLWYWIKTVVHITRLFHCLIGTSF